MISDRKELFVGWRGSRGDERGGKIEKGQEVQEYKEKRMIKASSFSQTQLTVTG